MTKRVRALLDSIERLNEAELQEIIALLFRRHLDSSRQSLSDLKLIQIAEERFLDLDYREKDSV